MRNFGIFCIGLGGFSLLGALMAGHSAFGPLFWLALGIALVLIAKQKENVNKKEREQISKAVKQQPINKSQSNHIEQQYPKQKNTSKQQVIGSISTSSSLNINIPMTTAQKEAAMCLISYFGGYNDDIETDAEINQIVYMLSYQAATYFEVQNFPKMLPGAMSRNSDPDKMLDTVMTIEDRQYKEFLLLTCHDLAKISGNAEAYDLLYNIANEMGYNKDRFNALIKQYSRE